jgi:hypothetical protein
MTDTPPSPVCSHGADEYHSRKVAARQLLKAQKAYENAQRRRNEFLDDVERKMKVRTTTAHSVALANSKFLLGTLQNLMEEHGRELEALVLQEEKAVVSAQERLTELKRAKSDMDELVKSTESDLGFKVAKALGGFDTVKVSKLTYRTPPTSKATY